MKKCSKCKQIKPLSEFYKDRTKKDGYRSECKICKDKYQQTEKGKVARYKANKKYEKTEKGKTTRRIEQKLFYARHPNRLKAKTAVNNAIKVGKLPRPDTLLCYYCSKPAKQYHHWKGYEKKHWLDVIPVCAKCHHKCNRRIT